MTLMCAMEWGVYAMSAAFCVLLVAFTLALVPETKGLPLERCGGAPGLKLELFPLAAAQ